MTFATTAVRLLLLAGALALTACDDPQGVGLLCVLAEPATVDQSVADTQSLDCQARICLQLEASQPALCTAGCGDIGATCDPESSAECPSVFRCEVPFVTGPLKDRRLCVCEAYFDAIH
jgi:hypothetical protein